MIILFELIDFMLLFLPTIWEVKDDEKGDFDKALDVVKRVFIALVVGAIIWIGSALNLTHHHGFLASSFLSLSLHFLIFDYIIAYVLGHSDWFTYMGKGVIDRIPFWNTMNPWLKLSIRVVVFIIAIMFYFK